MKRIARHGMSFSVALTVLACAAVDSAAAPAAPAQLDNLGDSLLDDDLARLFAPPAEPEGNTEAPPEGGLDWLPDAELLRRLTQENLDTMTGEDIGGGSPLASVVSGMKEAVGLIQDDADDRPAVPVQRQVVTQLERLIQQMEKQCQGGSCNKPSQGDKQKQASKRSQPKPGECDKEGQCDKPGSQAKKAGGKPNQSGTTSLGSAPDAQSPEGRQALLKAAWGHLPERVREQMLKGAGGEFLPEYRDELERYFQKLAERTDREEP